MTVFVKALFLSSVVIALLLSGCMGGGWGGGFSMPPAMVETTVASMEAVEDQFQTVGTLEADYAVTLVAEIGGLVISIPFDEGGHVERGALIAQLDDRELRAELDRTSAVRDQAQASFNRVQKLFEQGAIPQQDLDDADAALKVAIANVASAAARLDKTRITAPFSGIIGARQISPGAYLRPGDAIAHLAKVQELRVTFSAPERFAAQLERGSDVAVTTTAFPGEELTGRIEVIEPSVDSATRSLMLVARVPNPKGHFRPGMSANVAAVLNRRPSALTISSEAVIVDQNQTVVYVVKPDSTVARTVLELGSRMRDKVEVLHGLTEGQRVVRAGHQKIFEGAKVIPVTGADSTGALGSTMASGQGQR